MTEFKLLKGGTPTMNQISTEIAEMRDMLESIEAITENYLLSQMEEAAAWCWNHREMFPVFNDAFKAYLEQRK